MNRLILKLLLAMLALSLAGGAWLVWYATRPIAVAGGSADFTIERGTPVPAIAQSIREAGIDVNPSAFYWLARLSGKARLIKAGSYEIGSGLTLWQLLLKLSAGDVSQRELRIIEGWTFRQVRAALDAHPDLVHDTRELSDAEILKKLGAEETHAEGLFFPDTYLFDLRSSDLQVLRRAHHEMKTQIERAWAQRDGDLPLTTPYQALTLASLIEKETGRHEDRPLIASVFINRLRLGMRLQTDPSVIYGLGESFDGNLRKRDLLQDTPYNTYVRAGLPPTPIAMPGRASIEASLRPAATDFIYFVARGDGSSVFSRGLDEHNRAVAKYQQGGGR